MKTVEYICAVLFWIGLNLLIFPEGLVAWILAGIGAVIGTALDRIGDFLDRKTGGFIGRKSQYTRLKIGKRR